MLIHELCKRCGVTRKAVAYYEKQGLLLPETLENGYRSYQEADVERVQEIAVLRRCGMGIEDIRMVLGSKEKKAQLMRFRHRQQIKAQKRKAGEGCLDELIDRYDIAHAFEKVSRLEEAFTIEEKLLDAFPGSYGVYIAMHFGRFLRSGIEGPAQESAYEAILSYLDEATFHMPQALVDQFETAMPLESYEAISDLQAGVQRTFEQAIADPDAFLDREEIKAYVQYRTSEAYKASEQAQMAKAMVDFQRNSGYQKIFLENLKILSPEYSAYCRQLEAMNEVLRQKHPDWDVEG